MRAFVGFGPEDGLDALLDGLEVPSDPDVLSIDIDGNDYHAWKAIVRLRPKLVCVEFNPTVPNEVDFVQAADPTVQQGCGVASLVRLGAEKGYRLVCCTQYNALFVDGPYFAALGVEDNSLDLLRADRSFVTYLFCGYDGRIMLDGYKHLLWHQMPIEERRVQQLPPVLRGFQDDYSPGKRLAFRAYRRALKMRRGAT